MGLLAFPVDTPLQPYRELLDPARWQALIQQFRSLTSKTLQVRAIRILKTVFFSATDRLVQCALVSFQTKYWFLKYRLNILLTSPSLGRSENYKLHQLSPQSVLSVTLQAGLSSLKTPHCYRQGQFTLTGLPSYMQVQYRCTLVHSIQYTGTVQVYTSTQYTGTVQFYTSTQYTGTLYSTGVH